MFRYPLERLDDSVDALYISIFDQVRSDIFGLGDNITNTRGNIDIKKIGAIQSYNDYVAGPDKEIGDAGIKMQTQSTFIYQYLNKLACTQQ